MSNATSYRKEQVVGIINSVLNQIHTPTDNKFEKLSKELIELKEIIEDLRTQLHDSDVSQIGENIPTASEELDAVLAATEEATHTIMGSCEAVLEAMNGQDQELFNKVEGNIIKIFEACTFQDITGQRIKKVSVCLKQIEEKTNSILFVLDAGKPASSDKLKDQDNDTPMNLMNGPALPDNAMSQEDIDKLLAEFDE